MTLPNFGEGDSLIMKFIHPRQIDMTAKATERGSATVVALLVLGLLTVFVTVALTRNTNEALAMRNDAEEGRTFYAAQASLETMTRNFNKVFETKINPLASDLDDIENKPVFGFSDYQFTQTIQPSSTPSTVVIPGGDFAGLNAIRDAWTITSTATAPSGTQVRLTRNFFNNRIPIFQFGIFYDGDLTLYNPPPFYFGGRVHSNKNFFLTPVGNEIRFDSRVSASGEIVTQVQRTGVSYADYGNRALIKNGSGVFVNLAWNKGSVLGGPDLNNTDPDMPNGSVNPNWAASKALFDGNLLDHTAQLKLPIRLASGDSENFGNVRTIKRGRVAPTGTTADQGGDAISATSPVTASNQDSPLIATERYYGKPSLRISLADSKARLPGCAANTIPLSPVTDACGVRLDVVAGSDDQNITDAYPSSSTSNVGYQPLPMVGSPAYSTTRFNAYRAYRGITRDDGSQRQVWIKVELVTTNVATGLPRGTDITRDFLSLGITEQAPTTTGKYTLASQEDFKLVTADSETAAATAAATPTPAPFYDTASNVARDSRSIIKLQRWGIPGPQINTDSNAVNPATSPGVGTYKFINSGTGWNVVTGMNTQAVANFELGSYNNGTATSIFAKMKVGASTIYKPVFPIPIEMFDPREGIHNENMSPGTVYGTNTVPLNGVMSMIDLDVNNMRRFLNGEFDGKFPTSGTPFADAKGRGLRASDVPLSNGWIVYISDRRGDWVFNGDYEMEDLFGNTDGLLQTNEDMNANGLLDVGGTDSFSNQARPYVWEGTKYTVGGSWLNADSYQKLLYPANPTSTDRYATANKDIAAFADHRYYRRGVRLINATVLPGQTDLSAPGNTRGFTVACEQGVYLLGNYNTSGLVAGSTFPTPAVNYLPQATTAGPTTGHSPAAIAADQVAFLSNSWTDGNAWRNPFASLSRVASDTTYRTALLMGAAKERLNDGGPNQGSTISPTTTNSNGGVHNFINMREDWNGKKLNYAGSLVSIFTNRYNTGAFKCCNVVYRPPTRNWTFDTSFLDPARIPPGTPMFQYVQVTGFQRTNE
jgi:hypothetical protein